MNNRLVAFLHFGPHIFPLTTKTLLDSPQVLLLERDLAACHQGLTPWRNGMEPAPVRSGRNPCSYHWCGHEVRL